MSGTRISALTSLGTPVGDELVPVVATPGGAAATRRTTIDAIAARATANGAVAATRSILAGAGLNGGGNLTADRTISVATMGITTTMLADGAVTPTKMSNLAGSRILGRWEASSGIPQEIAVGATLSLSAGTLAANVGTGPGTVAAGDDTRIVNAAQRNSANTFTATNTFTASAADLQLNLSADAGRAAFLDFEDLTVVRNRIELTTARNIAFRTFDAAAALTGTPLVIDNAAVRATITSAPRAVAAGSRDAVGRDDVANLIATGAGIASSFDTATGIDTLGLTGQALALHNISVNGLVARTGAGTVAARSLADGANITVTNPDGVAGNPTIAVTGNLPVARFNSGSGASAATFWRGDGTWAAVSGGGTFLSLTDTPASYVGQAGRAVRVNAGATGLEFFDAAGTGTVTSVAFSGGTTGLTATGSPITSAGTITLEGTLAVASGGTGATAAPAARTNLGLGGAATLNVGTTAGTVAAGDDSRIVSAVANTRQVATGAGLTGGGNLTADRTLALTGQALAVHNLAANGLVARTGAGTVAARTITGGANISVTAGDGVAGNPTVAVTGLAAVATSGSAADLIAGTLPAARFDDVAHGSRGGGALHPAFTATTAGFVPPSGGGTTTFLRADGTFVAPPGGGGGGSPGGAPGTVQWNSAGSFAGASGLTINATGEPSVERFIDTLELSLPPDAPAPTAVRMFAIRDAGLLMPALRLTSAPSIPLQTAVGARRHGWLFPTGAAGGGGTSFQGINATLAGIGSVTYPTGATRVASEARISLTPAAAPNAVAGWRSANVLMWRGNGANRGGFDLWMCVATLATNAETSAFFGLTSATNVLGGADPRTDRPDMIGIGRASTDTQWHAFRRTGTGSAAAVPLGLTFNTTGGDFFVIRIVCEQNGPEVGIRVTHFPNDFSAPSVLINTTWSTGIPLPETFLAPQAHLRAGATSFAPSLAHYGARWELY